MIATSDGLSNAQIDGGVDVLMTTGMGDGKKMMSSWKVDLGKIIKTRLAGTYCGTGSGKSEGKDQRTPEQ